MAWRGPEQCPNWACSSRKECGPDVRELSGKFDASLFYFFLMRKEARDAHQIIPFIVMSDLAISFSFTPDLS